MCSDLVRHQTVHLLNPNINYIRTENCKYCKLEKRMNYRNRYRNNQRYLNENYELFYNPELYDSTFYNMEQPESVEKSTTLKLINRSTCLELSKKEEFCSICQDTIPKNSIIAGASKVFSNFPKDSRIGGSPAMDISSWKRLIAAQRLNYIKRKKN